MTTDIPDQLQNTGHFVEGGYRPPPPGPRLPPISDVTHGSVFEDHEGVLWKAINGQVHGKRWARAVIVSPQKHRTVTR